MRRLMHLLAILALVGSALYAYRTKYDTLYLAEQVRKMRNQIAAEKDGIAVLKAEWQYLNKPDRVQILADKFTDLQPFSIRQVVRWSDIPARQGDVDSIGRKLEALGLSEPTNTPSASKASDGRTGGGKTPGVAQ
jgi:hypothetical protein